MNVSKNRLLGLLRFMTGYRLRYVVAALSTGVATVSQAGTYLLLRYFVDKVLPQHAVTPILWTAAAFLGLAFFQGSFSFVAGRLAAQTAEGVTRRLRNSFFDHLQKLPFSYHDKTPTGDLVERATSDMDAVRKFYADQAIMFGRIVLMFVVNFGALCFMSLHLALVSVAVIPIILAVSIVFFHFISRRYERYQEQEAILTTTLQENLTGVRVVRAFARQLFEMRRFETVNWEKYRRGRRLIMMNAFFWPLSDFICGAQMLTGLAYGAVLAISGALTVGTFVAFTGMIGRLIWPIRFLGRLIVDISSGLVSYERIATVLRQEQEPIFEGMVPSGRLKGRLEFRNMSFGYDSAEPILTDISFSCETGMTIALLGSTGSGKTSLVNLIPRFYEYTRGQILLDGKMLDSYQRQSLRQQVGIVEQEPFLFSRSIRENITYGVHGDVSTDAIERAARAASIHDVILDFPEGYDTLVGEKGVTLSGGQKQRVAIARTILKDPAILILDDSTSSVDTETEAEIRSALEHLMKGRTSFVIAHRIQSLMRADLILVFRAGRIVESGNHEELIKSEGMYRKIFELQTRIESELQEEIAGV